MSKEKAGPLGYMERPAALVGAVEGAREALSAPGKGGMMMAAKVTAGTALQKWMYHNILRSVNGSRGLLFPETLNEQPLQGPLSDSETLKDSELPLTVLSCSSVRYSTWPGR